MTEAEFEQIRDRERQQEQQAESERRQWLAAEDQWRRTWRGFAAYARALTDDVSTRPVQSSPAIVPAVQQAFLSTLQQYEEIATAAGEGRIESGFLPRNSSLEATAAASALELRIGEARRLLDVEPAVNWNSRSRCESIGG